MQAQFKDCEMDVSQKYWRSRKKTSIAGAVSEKKSREDR